MTTSPIRKTYLRQDADGRAVHDVGGLDFGPVDRSEHDLALWEKRTDAMLILLASKKNIFKIDAMRRVIEDYGQQEYDRTTYYQKWIRAIRNLLIEQEVLTTADLDQRMREIASRHRDAGREVEADHIEPTASDPR